MARRPRLAIAGVPQHVIQRGNNRLATFFTDEDYRFYLACLAKLRAGMIARFTPGERFKDEVEAALERAARPSKRGRPAVEM